MRYDIRVLIEPLWNWNMKQSAAFMDPISLNRTFMELKCRCLQSWATMVFRLNRTFMELKSNCYPNKGTAERVLIEPLWNWNLINAWCRDTDNCLNRTFMELKLEETEWGKPHQTVLIEPLWNWNSGFTVLIWSASCLNRTFMELK